MNKDLENRNARRAAALHAAEDALHTREESLNRLLAGLPDVIWTTSEDMKTAFISPNVESMFGYSPAEVRENTANLLLKSIHPEDWPRVLGAYRALFSRGQRFDEEFRLKHKDGRWIWVHDRAVRTHIEKDGALYADGVLSDITARKAAEEARSKSDQRYRLLVERNLAGVFRAEAGGKVLDCNPALVRMLGYDSTTELVGHPSREVLYDPAEEIVLLENLSKSGFHNNVELRLRRKDGTFIWALHNICLVTPNHGERPCIEGTVINVTKERESAVALQNQLSLMEAINTSAPDGLIMLDAEGRVTSVNPAGQRMLGYTQAELRGRVLHDVCHGKSQDGHPLLWSECPIAQACASGKTLHGHDDLHFRKDGTPVNISFSSAPLYEGNRWVGSVLVMHDITKRKLAEQEHRSLQEQFLQAQKMEAIGRLAGGIAHDFNNLLQVINGYASLIAVDSDSDPKLLATRARAIQEAGTRAAQLTQQLLDFSRKDPGGPHVIPLGRTLKDLLYGLRTLVGENIDLTTRISSGNTCVRISAGQLEQVVMNLMVNARDAMPNGGELDIEARRVNLDESTRRAFGSVQSGTYVRISVSDTGCGMNAATMRRAFEPFFTTKEPGKGSGLGLSTVYGIVTNSGGGISIDSKPGAGTVVRVCLPVAECQAAAAAVEEHIPPQRGTECVLLAEDEREVRSLIAGQLTSLGYTVVEAGNGREALQLATDSPHRFDMLITDMIMPKMGGQELSQKVMEICPAIKTIQMSGYSDVLQKPSQDDPRKIPHLQKPFELGTLAATIRRALDQKPF